MIPRFGIRTRAWLAAAAALTARVPAPLRFAVVAALPAVLFVVGENGWRPASGYVLAVAVALLLAGFRGALLALAESYVFLLVEITDMAATAGEAILEGLLLSGAVGVIGGGVLALERTRRAARADAERLSAALEELREKSDLLDRAQEVGAVGTWVWDAATNRSVWSESTLHIYGFTAEEAASGDPERFWQIVHPDEREDVERLARSSFDEARIHEVEHRIVRADGDVRWLRTRGAVECDADGRPVRQLGVVIDVTESRKTESELREKTARLEHTQEVLRRAQEIGKLGSFVTDLRAGRVEWSRELALLFGAGGEAFESSRERYWSFIHRADADAVIERLAAAVERDDRVELEYRVVRTGGRTIWVQVHASIDRDADGTARRLVGIVQDVTEQRALEEQFRQAQKLEAVGQLAAGVAHDFNNLLTVIAGNAELARGAVGSAAVEERLTEILRSSARAGDLVRQLLAFSRADAVEPRVVDLNRTVGGVRRMLDRLLEENIEVSARLATGEMPVAVDPGQLEQVLLNLAVNARDAMPGGGRLTISSDADAGTVTLRVSDTGTGMDAHTRERIFDPFFTTKPPGQGTGLGLSTVYGIVSRAGGEIAVDTAPGRGTTFTIMLPRAGGRGEAEPAIETPPLTPGGGERVLVVEDEPLLLAVTAEILTRAGYDVVTATDGEAALEAIGEHPPFDIVVSDLVMPGLTGTKLVEELRARGHEPPIVYTSGYPQGVLGAGGLDERTVLVAKPFTGEQITTAMRTLLDRTAVQARKR